MVRWAELGINAALLDIRHSRGRPARRVHAGDVDPGIRLIRCEQVRRRRADVVYLQHRFGADRLLDGEIPLPVGLRLEWKRKAGVARGRRETPIAQPLHTRAARPGEWGRTVERPAP